MRYEFKIDRRSYLQLETFLEDRSREGWELHTLTPHIWKESITGDQEVREYLIVMKRPA